MNTLAHSGVFWVGLIAGLVLIYFLPTMIGIIRKVESLGLLIFLNVLPDRRRMVCCDGDGVHTSADLTQEFPEIRDGLYKVMRVDLDEPPHGYIYAPELASVALER